MTLQKVLFNFFKSITFMYLIRETLAGCTYKIQGGRTFFLLFFIYFLSLYNTKKLLMLKKFLEIVR